MDKLGRAFFLVCLGLLLFASSVLAITTPDSTPAPNPALIEVTIWRHYLEEDDLLVVAYYRVAYASLPAETIEDAFIGRFGETGSADFGSVTPEVYDSKGYGEGIFTIYFPASDVTNLEGFIWGDSDYVVRLSGNPSLTWTPTYSTVSSTSLSWKAYSTHEATIYADNALADKILGWAQDLGLAWTETMLESGAEGNVLSDVGEAYFTLVFPDLRIAIPGIFQQQIQAPIFRETDHPKTYEGSLTAPTFIQEGMTAFTDFWGLTAGYFGLIIAFVVLIACLVLSLKLAGEATYGILASFVVYLGLAKMGVMSLTSLGIASLVCIILLAFIFFLKRA